jgi:hypothetical protein
MYIFILILHFLDLALHPIQQFDLTPDGPTVLHNQQLFLYTSRLLIYLMEAHVFCARYELIFVYMKII